MKTVRSKYFLPFLLIGSTILPGALDVLLYRNGAMDNLILFLPIVLGLSVLHYKFCPKAWQFFCMQILMLLCSVIGGDWSANLYYRNVSNDALTPVIGELRIILQAIIILCIAIAATMTKALLNYRHKHSPEKKN